MNMPPDADHPPPPPPPPHPRLTPDALATIYAHARRDFPKECCGLVFGPHEVAVADRAIACANVQDRLHAQDAAANPRDARTAYSLDAPDLFRLQKSLRGPEPAKIVYHSHVDISGDGAYFSDTDQTIAQLDGEPTFPVEYVVIDIKSGTTHGAAQFAWDAVARKYVEVGRYP